MDIDIDITQPDPKCFQIVDADPETVSVTAGALDI